MEAALIRQGRTLDDGAFVARFVGLLDARHVRYCVIGGEAVNVHAGPGITFGLDLIVEAEDLAGCWRIWMNASSSINIGSVRLSSRRGRACVFTSGPIYGLDRSYLEP